MSLEAENIAGTSEAADEELIRRIIDGDRAAEQELFERFSAAIVHQVKLKLGIRSDDWQDVSSEAKVAVLTSLRGGKFNSEKGRSLASYIYGITRFKILDYFRETAKHPHGNPEGLDRIPQEERISETELRERTAMLTRAMDKLKPKYREILYLRYYKGLSVQEISQKLDLEPRRVSERVHYALKLLRRKCKPGDFLSIFFLFL